jgi:hypothetical protein
MRCWASRFAIATAQESNMLASLGSIPEPAAPMAILRQSIRGQTGQRNATPSFCDHEGPHRKRRAGADSQPEAGRD